MRREAKTKFSCHIAEAPFRAPAYNGRMKPDLYTKAVLSIIAIMLT